MITIGLFVGIAIAGLFCLYCVTDRVNGVQLSIGFFVAFSTYTLSSIEMTDTETTGKVVKVSEEVSRLFKRRNRKPEYCYEISYSDPNRYASVPRTLSACYNEPGRYEIGEAVPLLFDPSNIFPPRVAGGADHEEMITHIFYWVLAGSSVLLVVASLFRGNPRGEGPH